MKLESFITAVPDFPKKGIVFRDITPLLAHPQAFRFVTHKIAEEWAGRVGAVAALDARGFLFGAPVAQHLGVPLVPLRKKGKLPGEVVSRSYGLEYGSDTIEMKPGVITPGLSVLIVDDLLATGGTARAACELVESVGGTVAGCAFVIELASLNGRVQLPGRTVQSLVTFE